MVQLRRIENRGGEKEVTLGNSAGDYVLICNQDANGEPIASCASPDPQRDYLLFRGEAKWRLKGAKVRISLELIQQWTVTYLQAENVGLMSASGHGGFGIYWLSSWTRTGQRLSLHLLVCRRGIWKIRDHPATNLVPCRKATPRRSRGQERCDRASVAICLLDGRLVFVSFARLLSLKTSQEWVMRNDNRLMAAAFVHLCEVRDGQGHRPRLRRQRGESLLYFEV